MQLALSWLRPQLPFCAAVCAACRKTLPFAQIRAGPAEPPGSLAGTGKHPRGRAAPVRTAEPSLKSTPRTRVCFFLSAPNSFTSIPAGVDEPSNVRPAVPHPASPELARAKNRQISPRQDRQARSMESVLLYLFGSPKTGWRAPACGSRISRRKTTDRSRHCNTAFGLLG